MNVILLSTYLGPKAAKKAKDEDIRLNPASQNFYYRFAESLRFQFELLCASSCPTHEEVKDEGFLYDLSLLEGYIFENRAKILFFDSLSVHLTRLALLLRKKTGIKLIAICTDDPSNISNVPAYYPFICKFFARKADAYFCLTPELSHLFNKKKKPVLYQLGILEQEEIEPKEAKRPYIYLGGALYQRYGITDLIEAYEETKPNVDLVIAGHGPLDVVLMQKNGKTLQFLGKIDRGVHLSYIAGAAAVINPRRFDAKLDPVSVPSKVLEYLGASKYVISTISTPIKQQYGNLINWVEGDDNKAAWIAFFKEHMDEQGNLVNLVENKGIATVREALSSKNTGKRIADFINQLS